MRARCCTTTESLERALLSAKLNREYSKKLGRGLVTRLLPIEQTVWSKTILITRGVGGTGHTCQEGHFNYKKIAHDFWVNFSLSGIILDAKIAINNFWDNGPMRKLHFFQFDCFLLIFILYTTKMVKNYLKPTYMYILD